MAINTDQLKNGGKGKGFSAQGVSSVEGGGDLALALGNSVQNQTQEMVLAAHAAQINIHQAADLLSSYFARVASGQELLNETLAMTQDKLQAMGGPVTINTEVQPIVLNLPESRNFDETRRNFLGMFGGSAETIPNPFLAAAQSDEDCVHE